MTLSKYVLDVFECSIFFRGVYIAHSPERSGLWVFKKACALISNSFHFSMCTIDVEFFPVRIRISLLVSWDRLSSGLVEFDDQTCEMKFGSWTYGGLEVDLKHAEQWRQREESVAVAAPPGWELQWVVDAGIDLGGYYPSVEWDILAVPAIRHQKRYPCCHSPFIDITYELHLRRKALFYTVNLIFPSVGISFLTALVFYLPSDSGEKISLCISILISLTVFFLLLVEIIPSTSLVIPLIGKYLLFTMVLVTLSVVVTVVTLNVHYRSPTTHDMPWWIRRLFLDLLPRLLHVSRPRPPSPPPPDAPTPLFSQPKSSLRPPTLLAPPAHKLSSSSTASSSSPPVSPMESALDSVCYIAQHFRSGHDDHQVMEDWKYVAMVPFSLLLPHQSQPIQLCTGAGQTVLALFHHGLHIWDRQVINVSASKGSSGLTDD